MKPIAWILGGLALTGLSTVLESLGDFGSTPVAGLPLSVPAVLVLLGGQYCLWRGFRSGVVALWSGAFDRRRNSPGSDQPRSPYHTADTEPKKGFDADAAFARYMEQREADQDQATEMPAAPVVSQPQRPTFGRRAV
jgi:hypothetical protein